MESEGGARAELVIALVGAIGSDLPWVEARLVEALEQLAWRGTPVHLSDLMTPFVPRLPAASAPYDEYVDARMTAGNTLRERTADGSTIARLGVKKLRKARAEITGDEALPARRVAYILRSLKHPDEVVWLRRVYGPQFLLVGCHTPRAERITALASRIAASHRWCPDSDAERPSKPGEPSSRGEGAAWSGRGLPRRPAHPGGVGKASTPSREPGRERRYVRQQGDGTAAARAPFGSLHPAAHRREVANDRRNVEPREPLSSGR